MDQHRFDSLTRSFAQARSRRTVVRGLLGLGGAVAATAMSQDAEAARRGFGGPPPALPRPTPPPAESYCTPDGTCCVECTPFVLARFQNCYSNGSICAANPDETCCAACADWANTCNVTSS